VEHTYFSHFLFAIDIIGDDVHVFLQIYCSIIRAMIMALMMEAASISETLVNFGATRRNNPEDSHLHTCRRENPKP
jgi:hypothetical protein